jgi:LAO/AO transport system kinase
MKEIDNLINAALKGHKLSTARLISLVERGDSGAPYILEKISPHTGNAYTIGVTGPPGAGKSTLVDKLVSLFCRNRYSVGVIAVDPTSPFSGGALLGDRIRMNIKDKDWNVFFRSMSSGRVMGGLSRTTREAARILDAAGKQIVVIETVGVGQSELDIAQATDTVLVVLTPESGDTIQIMKAGLMEIADIFVVNKADRPGAEDISQSIQGMLAPGDAALQWSPPVYRTAASLNRGIDELYEGIWRHRQFLQEQSRLELRRKTQLKTELQRRIEEALSEFLWQEFVHNKDLDQLVEDTWRQKTDPRAAARRVVSTWLQNKDRSA